MKMCRFESSSLPERVGVGVGVAERDEGEEEGVSPQSGA